MKTTVKHGKESQPIQARAYKQSSISSILQKQAKNQSSNPVAQLWPFDKPLWVPGPGKGPIPFMGAQFDPQYRDPKHQELLQSLPEDQCPVKTFHQENDYASKYPIEGSKSKIGDAGIFAHRMYSKLGWPFK